MSVSPVDCQAIPGVYNVCLNDYCFPVTDETVRDSLATFDYNHDCVVDERDDPTGGSRKVANVYIDVMYLYDSEDLAWVGLGAERLDAFTKWISGTRELRTMYNKVFELGGRGASRGSVQSGTTHYWHVFNAVDWKAVIIPTVGEDGGLYNALQRDTCESFRVFWGRDSMPFLDNTRDMDVGVMQNLVDSLPKVLRPSAVQYLQGFVIYRLRGDMLADYKESKIECGDADGDECPDGDTIYLRDSCEY